MPYRLLLGCLFVAGLLAGSAAPVAAQPFTFTFVETSFPPVNYGSLDWADADADGDLDLLVAGNEGRFGPFVPTTYLALSQGEAARASGEDTRWTHTYERRALARAMWHTEAAWQDVDGDGDLDVVVTGTAQAQPPFEALTVLYRNEGGTLQPVEAGLAGLYGGAAAWGDVDNDGDADLLLTGSTTDEALVTRLYRNDGGTFALADASLRDVGYGDAAWGDYDADGDLDLVVSGADNTGAFHTDLYRNDGGQLVDASAGLEGLAFTSLAWGDVDADGDLDLLLTGGELSPQLLDGVVRLYRNDGGNFTPTTSDLPGVVYGTSSWGDYDNDGDLDILLLGGQQALGSQIGRIYQNDGSGSFRQTVTLAGASIVAAAWGDYDYDGDLDIATSGLSSNGGPLTNLYRNDSRLVNTPPTAPDGLQAGADGGRVTLRWNAAADEQTPTPALTYALRVGTSPGAANVVAPAAVPATGRRLVPQPGNAGPGTAWTLQGLPAGTYHWSVQAVDASYQGGPFAPEGTFTVGAGGEGGEVGTDTEDAGLPTVVALHPGYPNPFASQTTFRYELPQATPVRLVVYNVLGAEVAHLHAGDVPAGRHEVVWDGRSDGGTRVSAGVYFVRLETGTTMRTQKVVVLN